MEHPKFLFQFKKQFYFILSVIFFSNSCTLFNLFDTKINCPTPTHWEVVWSNRNNPKKFIFGSGYADVVYGPLIFENGIVTNKEDTTRGNSKVKMFNKTNGDLIWTWNNYFSNDNGYTNKIYRRGDKVLLFSGGLYCINALDGSTAWRIPFNKYSDNPEENPNFNEDKLIIHQIVKITDTTYKSALIEINLTNGSFDTILNIKVLPKFKNVAVNAPLQFKNALGETILVFGEFHSNYSTNSILITQTDIVGYNYSKKTEEFRLNSTYSENIENICIIGNNFIYNTYNNLHCFDLVTKKEIWSKIVHGYNFNRIGDNLAFGANPNLYLVNPKTGCEIWKSCDSIYVSNRIIFQGNKIFTSGNDEFFFIFDANTGKTLWKERSPNYCNDRGTWNYDIDIDSTLGNIYTSDYISTMCLKIPKL